MEIRSQICLQWHLFFVQAHKVYCKTHEVTLGKEKVPLLADLTVPSFPPPPQKKTRIFSARDAVQSPGAGRGSEWQRPVTVPG